MQRPIIVIGRNPYGRFDYIRQCEGKAKSRTCLWCGGVSANGLLYRYGTQHDGIYARPSFDHGSFCSRNCHRTYHER